MSGIDLWLNRATSRLSADSAAQVASEIRAHYDSARESALAAGATASDADAAALAALGDPVAANREYRKVLLTKSEARVLRQGVWESGAFCARRRALLSVPGIALLASAALMVTGHPAFARDLLIVGTGVALLLLLPFLPLYTASRSRWGRYAKWILLAALPVAVLGSDSVRYCGLLFACAWPIFHVERTRESIRRKLPIARWPKHLYL